MIARRGGGVGAATKVCSTLQSLEASVHDFAFGARSELEFLQSLFRVMSNDCTPLCAQSVRAVFRFVLSPFQQSFAALAFSARSFL